jgi:predicted nucleic acid-binding protein
VPKQVPPKEQSSLKNQGRQEAGPKSSKLVSALTALEEPSGRFDPRFEARGLDALDALHLAVASGAKADYFTTCDDRLLKKAQQLQGLACKIVSALGLVSEVTK